MTRKMIWLLLFLWFLTVTVLRCWPLLPPAGRRFAWGDSQQGLPWWRPLRALQEKHCVIHVHLNEKNIRCIPLTGAVEFNRWKAQLFGDVSVLDLQSFIHLRREEGSTQTVPKNKRNSIKYTVKSAESVYSQICLSPTRWPESWRRWRSRSQTF